MFIGHLAVAFAAKNRAPRTSLGALLLAVGFVDLIWPFFLMLGWEQVRIHPGDTAVTPLEFVSYPWSHSFVMGLVWALVVGGIYYWRRSYKAGALWMGIGVLSHWFLDFASHRADMPLWPGGPVFGLGLWNSRPGTALVELTMFALGLWIYLQSTRPARKNATRQLTIFVIFLLVMYSLNFFGPPPPSEQALMFFAPLAWLIPLWGWKVDKARSARV
jgi:hypothetical protein